jgi:hypothetical protein
LLARTQVLGDQSDSCGDSGGTSLGAGEVRHAPTQTTAENTSVPTRRRTVRLSGMGRVDSNIGMRAAILDGPALNVSAKCPKPALNRMSRARPRGRPSPLGVLIAILEGARRRRATSKW